MDEKTQAMYDLQDSFMDIMPPQVYVNFGIRYPHVLNGEWEHPDPVLKDKIEEYFEYKKFNRYKLEAFMLTVFHIKIIEKDGKIVFKFLDSIKKSRKIYLNKRFIKHFKCSIEDVKIPF